MSGGIQSLLLQAVNNRTSNFLVAFPLDSPNCQEPSAVIQINQQYGEFGYQTLKEHKLSILSESGFEQFESREQVTGISIPQPALRLQDESTEEENEYLSLVNLATDPLNRLFITGFSTGSVEFGDEQSVLEVQSLQEAVFLAKYDTEGTFEYYMQFVTSRGSQITLPDFKISSNGNLLALLNNKADTMFGTDLLTSGSTILLVSACTEDCGNEMFCDIQDQPECLCSAGTNLIGEHTEHITETCFVLIC